MANGILLRSAADGGVVIATLAPVSTNQSDHRANFSLTISTQYPFGDSATITLVTHRTSGAMPLHLRIPGWATNATVAVETVASSPAPDHAGAADAVRAVRLQTPANGTLFTVNCPARATVVLHIELNPTIRVEKSWGLPATNATAGRHPRPARPATNAAAVVRGSLLFTLPLAPIATVVRTWAPFNNTDLALNTTTPWRFALDLAAGAKGGGMQFFKNPETFNESLPFGLSK